MEQQDLQEVIKDILSILEQQSLAIQHLAEKQAHMALSNETLVGGIKNFTNFRNEIFQIQQQILDNQKILLDTLFNVKEQIQQTYTQHLKTEQIVEMLIDVYGNDIVNLRKRVADLESRI